MHQLYALKDDLDMLTEDVKNLKHGYGLLDYIAKVVHDSELEQLAQAAQMRRMEGRFVVIEKRLDSVEKRLDNVEQRLDAVEKRLDAVEKRLDAVEKRLDAVEKRLDVMDQRLDKMEKMLRLICEHLGIQPVN